MFKKFSRTKKILLVIGLVSIIGLIYLNSKLRTNPPTTVDKISPTPKLQIVSPNSQISQLKAEVYSMSLPSNITSSIPSKLPVYTASEPPSPTLDTLTRQFIQLYNLKPSPNSATYYYSSDKTLIYYYDTKNMYASFSVDGTKKPSAYLGKNLPKTDPAINSANQFLKSFSEYQNLELQPNSTTYSKIESIGSDYEFTQDTVGANIITLSFTHAINGYKYRYSATISPSVMVSVSQNNQIVRAIFTPQPFPNLLQPIEYPLLSPNEIVTALNSGLGSVISAPLYNFPANVSTLPPTSITNLEIEYRYDASLKQVLPYYLLTGEFIPNKKSGKPVTIQILLPAVSL